MMLQMEKGSVLLSSIGTPTYAILSDLLAPAKPGQKLHDNIQLPCATISSLNDL